MIIAQGVVLDCRIEREKIRPARHAVAAVIGHGSGDSVVHHGAQPRIEAVGCGRAPYPTSLRNEFLKENAANITAQ